MNQLLSSMFFVLNVNYDKLTCLHAKGLKALDGHKRGANVP